MEISQAFNKAIKSIFCKKRWIMTFPALGFCGLVLSFFYIFSNSWVKIGTSFLSVFIILAILFSLSIILTKASDYDEKKTEWLIFPIIKQSIHQIISTLFLSIPMIISFFLMWTILGIYLLLKMIPGIGQLIGLVLSFFPFVIILVTILLIVIGIIFLFFAIPFFTVVEVKNLKVMKKIFPLMKKNIYSNFLLFFMSLLVFLVGFIPLIISFLLAKDLCFSSGYTIINIFSSFFMMLFASAILTPFIIFFFEMAFIAFEKVKSQFSNEENKS